MLQDSQRGRLQPSPVSRWYHLMSGTGCLVKGCVSAASSAGLRQGVGRGKGGLAPTHGVEPRPSSPPRTRPPVTTPSGCDPSSESGLSQVCLTPGPPSCRLPRRRTWQWVMVFAALGTVKVTGGGAKGPGALSKDVLSRWSRTSGPTTSTGKEASASLGMS